MQLSACLPCGVFARSSKRIVRTLLRADCPRALATGLTTRLIRAALPRAPARGLLLPRPRVQAAPTVTSRRRCDGPWDCGLQRQQWPWWPAALACAVQYSLSVTGTDSRDGSDGSFLAALRFYFGPDQQTIPRRDLIK
jgi:hypothetical protein